MSRLARLLAWWERHHSDATVRWTSQQPKQAVTTRRSTKS